MITFNVYLTGGTKGHATAGALDGELVRLAQLHEVEIHVRRCCELMCLLKPVNDGDGYFIVRHDALILPQIYANPWRKAGLFALIGGRTGFGGKEVGNLYTKRNK